MPSPLNVTNIPAPRTPLTDPVTGLLSREWYRFFLNLFILTGSGSNPISLEDLQIGPPNVTIDEINNVVDNSNANLAPAIQDPSAEIDAAVQNLAVSPPLQINNFVDTNYVDFQVGAPFTRQLARLGWNQVDQTLDLGMDYGVTQQIGQEQYARVGNTTGSTIPNGTVVGFAGATSDALLVAPYLADGATPSLYILGIMTHDLPDSGDKGYCTTWGFVRDIDTSAFSPGDILYASPTVAGELTNVKPTAPENVIPLAACIVSDATNGVIFVRPTIEQEQYYGEFTKTGASTSPASANTSYAITWDNTEIANGVSVVSNSQITVIESGLYQFDVTLQLQSNSGVDKNVIFWFKKNGTNIPNTSRLVTVSVNSAYTPIALADFFSLDAGDYVELWWQSNNTNVALVTVAAGGTAPNDYPAAPAGIIAVNQIQL